MKLIILLFAVLALKQANAISTVEVGLYYESLCPDSQDFYIKQFYPTYTKLNADFPKILTVNVVPFGNAVMTIVTNSTVNPKITFTCQHKAEECKGNIVETCAVAKFSQDKSLAFLNCMFESKSWKNIAVAEKECTTKLNLDINVLTECADSLVGTALEYYMAGQTNSLMPKHTEVPWVTINGVHTDDIQKKANTNLLKLVCDTFTGSFKPTACI